MSIAKKILFIGSSPRTEHHIQTELESSSIQHGINKKNPRNFELVTKQNVTNPIIQNSIQHEKPTVLHFSGHATEEYLITHDVNDNGVEDEMYNEDFVEIIRQTPSIECVVLNCCHSKNLATTIAEISHIRAVICTVDQIENQMSIAFTSGFYLSLVTQSSYFEAYSSGKTSVNINHIDNEEIITFLGDASFSTKHAGPIKIFFEKYVSVIRYSILAVSAIIAIFKGYNFVKKRLCENYSINCPIDEFVFKLSANKPLDQLIYKKGETINFFIRSNQEVFVRALNLDEKGNIIVFTPDFEIKKDQLNKKIPLGKDIKVFGEPGSERLLVMASDIQFPRLHTVEKNGYSYVQNTLEEVEKLIPRGIAGQKYKEKIIVKIITQKK